METPVRRSVGPADRITYEPSERWVRGMLGETTVVESHRPTLVWEPGIPVPFYVFPRADLKAGTLHEAEKPPKGGRRADSVFYDLEVDGRVLPNAAWTYPGADFADTVSLAWAEWGGAGLDHWYEEDEEIFVHPRDPYSRVDAIPSTRHVVASLDGRVLAETRRPVLLFETHLPTRYYFPPEDVRFDELVATESHTRCPYKGVASYWSHGDERDLAWAYPTPLEAVRVIQDHVAFYNERVDLTVDGQRVERPVTHFTPKK